MQKPQLEIIILAAGLGQRFERSGGQGHKALAPLWDSRGTLQLLLSRLRTCVASRDIPIQLVTGRFATEVEAALAGTDLRLLHNPAYASETLLQSLARAASTTDAAAVLVLFADTLYSLQAIEMIMQACEWRAEESALVAVSPVAMASRADGRTETRVGMGMDGALVSFDDPASDWQMAHAVVWPRRFLAFLIGTAQDGSATHQWQVLQRLAETSALPAARMIRLPAHATVDIDTIDDMKLLRHAHRIKPEHLHYFAAHVSKERTLDTERDSLSGSIYRKHCESTAAAHHELAIMQRLHGQRPDLVMEPLGVTGRCLQMRFAAGIRLYDLLRHLGGHPRGLAIRRILLGRCSERLRDIQGLLLKDGEHIASAPYPFAAKIVNLLQTLTALLGLPFSQAVRAELVKMNIAWDACCLIPFRDATTKNMVVGIKTLAPQTPSTERARRLSLALEQDDDYWKQVPIFDLDFTSTRERTAPEDDVISLLAHSVTDDPAIDVQQAVMATPLLPVFAPSIQRSDLAWFVRYLRFGGRKLLYKLINPQGFAVRFRYDEPCFYFERLPQRLSPDFSKRYPGVFALLLQLRDLAERYRGFIPDEGVHDAFLSSLADGELARERYWQESPLEVSCPA